MSVRGISDPAFPAEFLMPDRVDVDTLISRELGGVALNNPSQGRQVQTWLCWFESDTGAVKVSPESGSPVTTLFTVAPGAITLLSLAFDSNMTPAVAYVEGGVQKLRWFNTVTQLTQTDSYAGAGEGRVATDDKRRWAEGLSDVVFAYVRAGVLYYREQRDRYLVERVVGPTNGLPFYRFGMNRGGRLQFELQGS